MKALKNRKISIYLELSVIMIFAFLVSALLYTGLNRYGEQRIDDYFSSTDFIDKKNAKVVNNLQKYITEHDLSSGDSEALDKWMKDSDVTLMEVFLGDNLMYNSSNYKEGEYSVLRDYYSWGSTVQVTFADGKADVYIQGFRTYRYYEGALIAELVLSSIVFLTIVIFGIHQRMKYIKLLSREIRAVEVGELEHPFTIRGRDELTELAGGLEEMRKSFHDQLRQEAYLTQTHQQLVTEMSHDIRTPLTSLLIYTEILEKHKYKDEQQRDEYLSIIDKKAKQIKTISDNLFEYAMVTSKTQVELEPPQPFKNVFYDALSEMGTFLEMNGYTVEWKLEWEEDCRICIHTDYILRILDNLTSNIVKYASKDVPVKIYTEKSRYYAGLAFENKKLSHTEKADSSKIGLMSVSNMMESMHAQSRVEDMSDTYLVRLLFEKYQEA